MSILNAKRPEEIKVNMLMNKSVLSVGPDYTVSNVANIMLENQIHSMPVVENESEVVGFVTLGDCLKSLVNEVFHDRWVSKNASDVMSKDVKSIDEDADIFELESFFVKEHIHQAPVISKSGELVGMVSRRDALAGVQKLISASEHYKEEIKTPLQITLSERMKYLIKD